jgi:hypothetical protein
MKNIEQKENNLWWRIQFLEITRISLLFYAQTKKQEFYDFAKDFASQAEQFKGGEYKERNDRVL